MQFTKHEASEAIPLQIEEYVKEKIPLPYEQKYLDAFKSESPPSLIPLSEKAQPSNTSIVMEYTPLGNVAMWYDIKKESFCYHSDSTIPYRFLEVVARKYVITNNCKHLFVDMEQELQRYKDKQKEKIVSKPITETTNSVFAKFKNYNTNNSKSSVSAPSSQAISVKKTNNINNSNARADNKNTNNDNDYVLKENANRYTYEGRFSNFKPLIKVDKKLTDKRLALSFNDFKKLLHTSGSAAVTN